MIISGTPSVLVGIDVAKKKKSINTNDSSIQQQQKAPTPNIQLLDNQHKPFSQNESSVYVFKHQISYKTNLALKQYLDYDNLEKRQAVNESFGINLYA